MTFSGRGIKEVLHSCFIFYNYYGTVNGVTEKVKLNYNVIEFISFVPERTACRTRSILAIKHLKLLKTYELLI